MNTRRSFRINLENVDFTYPNLQHRLKSLGNKYETSKNLGVTLKNISFSVYENESVGLVGQNGAGKTTLLRILAGIYQPNSGKVDVTGSITTMFDSGFGLDLEATAEKNIYIRGLLLGKSESSIKKAIEDIKEFTDLGNKWGSPLRVFSTGMLSRVIVGLATAYESEVLLVDEGIGTTDRSFQEKTNNRLTSLLSKSSTLVLASHNEELMKKFCTKAILIENGILLEFDTVEKIWTSYKKIIDN